MKKFAVLTLLVLMATFILTSCGAEDPEPITLADASGTIDGESYTNSLTGLNFTLSGNWYFLSDEEIEEITGVTKDLLNGSGSELDPSVMVYDMMAMDSDTANNVNVMVQLAPDAEDVDFDEILDQSEAEILEMGASIGASYSFSEHSTAALSGIKFYKLTAKADMNGISYEQGCYIAIENGVCLNVTLTSYDGTPLEDIEAMFS